MDNEILDEIRRMNAKLESIEGKLDALMGTPGNLALLDHKSRDEIELIADAVVKKFIEHGKRKSQARVVAGLSIEEMKRRGREELMNDRPRRKKK